MFYKKFISALLAVILFVFAVCSVPVPAQASDRGGAYVNILDYATIKGRNDNYASCSSTITVTWDFTDTLGQVRGFEFEIWGTYRSADFTVDNVTFGTVAATDVSLEIPYSGIFRITGNFHDTSRSTVSLKLTSSATTYFNFERLLIYTVGTNRVPLTATINGGSPAGANYTGGSVSYPYSASGYNDHIFEIVVPFHQWSACDYIDVNFNLSTLSILSISSFIYDGVYIPIDHSIINLDSETDVSYTYHPHFVNMRLDLSDISPGTEDTDLVIVITHLFQDRCSLNMINLFGVFLSDGVDPDSVWHRVLYQHLLSLEDYFNSQFQLLAQMNTRVNNIVTAVNTFRTTFSTFAEDVQALMRQNTTAITEALSNLEMTVDIDFHDLRQFLDSWFNEFKGFFQQLINGTPVDETVTNEMQDAENELGGMTDQMGSLSPDVNSDDVNVDVDTLVPSDGMTSVSNIFVIFTGNSLVATMLTIVVSMALVGYIFFGKR